jgi:hypothetical protein
VILRIAIGRCSCRNKKVGRSAQATCIELLARLEKLRALHPNQLIELPESESEETTIDGSSVAFTTYRHALEGALTLVVVQALVQTLQWPTYFSAHRIGHVLADGLVVDRSGRIEIAPDNLLWAYR